MLIVEPDVNLSGRLVEAAAPFGHVQTAGDFATARLLLAERSFDWLITNVRLGDYNGLHLVHLVTSNLSARDVLVYDEHADSWLAGEALRMGAFYEPGDGVADAIAGYLRDTPPENDRRSALVTEVTGSPARRCADGDREPVPSPGYALAQPIRVTYRVEPWPVFIPLEVSNRSIRRGQAEP